MKDYAGDGVLVLVGAPTPMDDHAERAVAIAAAMRDAVLAITQRWSSAARHSAAASSPRASAPGRGAPLW